MLYNPDHNLYFEDITFEQNLISQHGNQDIIIASFIQTDKIKLIDMQNIRFKNHKNIKLMLNQNTQQLIIDGIFCENSNDFKMASKIFITNININNLIVKDEPVIGILNFKSQPVSQHDLDQQLFMVDIQLNNCNFTQNNLNSDKFVLVYLTNALYVQSKKGSATLTDCYFQNSFSNSKYNFVYLQSKEVDSQFIRNKALVGGAIYQININPKLIGQNLFSDNKYVYSGKDIISYPTNLKLVKEQSVASIQDIIFEFQKQKQEKMVPVSQKEIDNWNVEVKMRALNSSQSSLNIQGEQYIFYDQDSKSFKFKELKIFGKPVQIALIYFRSNNIYTLSQATNTYIQDYSSYIQISFRECIEILSKKLLGDIWGDYFSKSGKYQCIRCNEMKYIIWLPLLSIIQTLISMSLAIKGNVDQLKKSVAALAIQRQIRSKSYQRNQSSLNLSSNLNQQNQVNDKSGVYIQLFTNNIQIISSIATFNLSIPQGKKINQSINQSIINISFKLYQKEEFLSSLKRWDF
ncbi:hypothetical protein ABPG72_021854 [Tetrahymena utriculariae]